VTLRKATRQGGPWTRPELAWCLPHQSLASLCFSTSLECPHAFQITNTRFQLTRITETDVTLSVVCEVASAASLISMAGQSVQAASSLYAFSKACRNVQPRIQGVGQAMNHLCTLLSSVWKTALKAQELRGVTCSTLTNVFDSIRDCQQFLDLTEKQMELLKTRSKERMFLKA
jgi:hypothetical protein